MKRLIKITAIQLVNRLHVARMRGTTSLLVNLPYMSAPFAIVFNRFRTVIRTVLTISTLSLLALSSAHSLAGTVNCLDATLAKVTKVQGCELSTSATQDFVKAPLTVNQEAFFDFTDWEFIKKDDGLVNPQKGSWNLDDSVWDFYTSVMLVFKSGSGTTLTAYLLTPGATSGSWTSPFSYPQFNGPGMVDKKGHAKGAKDVSHISVYGRAEVVSVSESGSLALVAIGLLGLLLMRRRLV